MAARVVILGGSFAGLTAAFRLKRTLPTFERYCLAKLRNGLVQLP